MPRTCSLSSHERWCSALAHSSTCSAAGSGASSTGRSSGSTSVLRGARYSSMAALLGGWLAMRYSRHSVLAYSSGLLEDSAQPPATSARSSTLRQLYSPACATRVRPRQSLAAVAFRRTAWDANEAVRGDVRVPWVQGAGCRERAEAARMVAEVDLSLAAQHG